MNLIRDGSVFYHRKDIINMDKSEGGTILIITLNRSEAMTTLGQGDHD